MTTTAMLLAPQLAITRIAARPFSAPPPDATSYPAPLHSRASGELVRGWLVGATDGRTWGWWGPVPETVAADAVALDRTVQDRSPATPGAWAQRARRATRHAHTGALAVAAGAIELACWDLAGQTAGTPVWHLSTGTACPPNQTYATCFGIDPTSPMGRKVATAVSGTWSIQKWHPGLRLVPDDVDTLADAAGGHGRLALDFHGTWRPTDVAALCRSLGGRLAWVEEPYPPDDIHRSRAGKFGVPHAAGEHCYGPFESPILTRAGVDVWQPDAAFCGGYENLRALAGMARSSSALCAPHGGGFLPAVHAAAAGSPIWMVEHHLLLEPSRQAHLDRPLLPAFRHQDATVPVPDRPGWGGPLRKEVLGGHPD